MPWPLPLSSTLPVHDLVPVLDEVKPPYLLWHRRKAKPGVTRGPQPAAPPPVSAHHLDPQGVMSTARLTPLLPRVPPDHPPATAWKVTLSGPHLPTLSPAGPAVSPAPAGPGQPYRRAWEVLS